MHEPLTMWGTAPREVIRRVSVGLGWPGGRQQSDHTDKVVRSCHEVAGQLSPCQTVVARASEPANRLHPAKDLFNGLFTNDKFCWSRPAKLRLKWWHRAYRDR